MKKYRAFIAAVLLMFLILGCKSGADKKDKKQKSDGKIPGLATMQKFGKKLTPVELLGLVGEAMREVAGGGLAMDIYNAVLHSPNDQEVFIIEEIEFNEQGLATKIEGYVEVPATYIEYVRLGGLGVPVYEAKEPNEFGVIFGRPGDVAMRDGVIVKLNPFEDKDVYHLKLNAETYDKITRASVLYQAFAITRGPYLENMILELQGMLLNSASKDALLEAIKKFKEENPDLTETEVMVNFLKANQTYLDELKDLDKDAKKRIKEGKKLLNAIGSGCALQTISLVEHFTLMAAEIAAITLSAASLDMQPLANYISRNVPKGMGMKLNDLKEVQKYSKYQFEEYKKNSKKNRELWKSAMDLVDQIKD